MSQSPKYQIFISSTYEDLEEERDQVIRAVLEMGHIPVGMEMFNAADEEQWKIIQRHIEASDYYVVIVAHRYGSVVGDVSYTEKEYDYAVASKIPALGFIIDDSARWPEDRRDKGQNAEDQARRLKAFKQKVRQKPVDSWKTADELHGKVAIALMKTMTAQPRVGWIPASHGASAEASAELARLSKENAELRAALDAARMASDAAARFDEIERGLATQHISEEITTSNAPSRSVSATLLEVFDVVGESLVSGAREKHLAHVVIEHLIPGVQPMLYMNAIRPHVCRWLDEFILQDLVAHSTEVIYGSNRAATHDRWTLTDLGRAFLRNRRRQTANVP